MFRSIFLLACIATTAIAAIAQTGNSIKFIVKNNDTKQPIAEATVTLKDSDITASTKADGVAGLSGFPDGTQTFVISSLGYASTEVTVTFPLTGTNERTVFLELSNEVGEVTIESTRTGRDIEAEPTRVEAIDEEEIEEKINMRPANVSMILHESTGIQVQQTSATSNSQSVRIQGLDGRYTQILKDGFPAYGGFSGSLSLLEIPPLDLKQVEIIKGPSATFYGEGAIAGVVNFISKTPEDKPVTSLVFNQTSALGTDVSAFNSRKFSRFGYTLLGSFNFQREYDVDEDEFSELPRARSFALNPRFFFEIDDKTRLTIGNSFSTQRRTGGDMLAIRNRPNAEHTYFERNNSTRNVTTFNFERELSAGSRLTAKQSLAFFDREIATPSYRFGGRQFNSYTDVTYFRPVADHGLVFGFTAKFDRFREDVPLASALARNETNTTVGGYVQDTFDINNKLSLEAGFRLDAAKDYGVFALPRVSLLYRFTQNLTSRVGFGLGYKTPTIFTEDAETLLFRNVLPIDTGLKAERSRGGTFDINYRNTIGEDFSYSFNQMFFYTEITDPLFMDVVGKGTFRFANAESPVISRGFETNARFAYNIAKLFLGYTFTDAKAGYLPGDRRLTLLPRSRLNSTLVFEEHDNFKAGVEAYYTSRQTLSDRTSTPTFWEVGLFGEKTLGKISIFFNAENIGDVKQSNYSPVVIPPHTDPTFAEVYTHLEGRTFNGGIKVRL